ncbi:acyl-CoA dehydrogenase family protein [Nocardioides humi]|uniref:Acyl-CoA dehydrogenase family protein n=1 Tax=Nocardioides humi TaxID=449461 RepID=A0ABN2A7S9_9ACTN|nr:acyl-CoA dehydrogenase family protein [Nocardioides humi]
MSGRAWAPHVDPAALVEDDDLAALGATLRAALAAYPGGERVRERADDPAIDEPAFDERAWRMLADELGLAGVAAPPDADGLGLGLAGATTCLVETGRALSGTPALGVLLAGLLLAESERLGAGSDEQWAESRWTLPATCLDQSLAIEDAGARVSGTLHHVFDLAGVDRLVVRAGTPDVPVLALVALDAAGLRDQRHRSLDLTRDYRTLHLDAVPARVLLRGEPARRAVTRLRTAAVAAVAADQLGVADRALDAVREYVGVREQFGRPIGSFQAIKHRVADLLVAVERARAAVRAAAVAWDAGSDAPEADLAAAVAGLTATEAALLATEEAVQLHGGIGFTWEHDAHLWYRRALDDEALQGGVRRCRARVVSATRAVVPA